MALPATMCTTTLPKTAVRVSTMLGGRGVGGFLLPRGIALQPPMGNLVIAGLRDQKIYHVNRRTRSPQSGQLVVEHLAGRDQGCSDGRAAKFNSPNDVCVGLHYLPPPRACARTHVYTRRTHILYRQYHNHVSIVSLKDCLSNTVSRPAHSSCYAATYKL